MKAVKFLISIIVVTVTLFLWSGITQMLPWGVPSANTLQLIVGLVLGALIPILLIFKHQQKNN